MRLRNIIFIVLFLSMLSGCRMGPSTYEIFEYHRNWTVKAIDIPKVNYRLREVYSEDKYIYKFEYPKGCHFGYLTNRDDKPEKVIGWIIISGKEFCKAQKNYTFQI